MPQQPAAITVTRKAVERVRSGHPWIFRSDIADTARAKGGDVVRVVERSGRFVAMAHYSSSSQIALRVLTAAEEAVDAAFFRRRLEQARQLRERVVSGSNAWRAVYSEGDALPGLIVDRYADWLVLQTLSQGMERAKPMLLELLQQMYSPRGIVERNDSKVRDREELPRQAGVAAGECPERIEIEMNGLRFAVQLLAGQKTGAFLDQRENYAAAAQYARGQALDCFTYGGGFALHLARRCEAVEAVDSSPEALATAAENAKRNGLANVRFTEANAFDLLRSYDDQRRAFDTVVLDPPAFAKTRGAIEGALRGYKEINLRALRLLRPGGVLVSCSCSHHVSEAEFISAVAEAALDARRQVVVLERRTQARDHPVSLTVPETMYLKCLVVLVSS